MVKYDLPLNEVCVDFYDRLKSVSKGYASFDYHLTDYKAADLGENVDPGPMTNRSTRYRLLVHRTRAETRGRGMVEKLKELIPPHMFQVPIQAAIGGKIHRARNRARLAQGCDREMLRRRRHPQTQTARQAEEGQKAHAAVRQSRTFRKRRSSRR